MRLLHRVMKAEAKTQSRSAPAPRKILIVDDHKIVREGLALLLNRERDLRVCGEAADLNGVMQHLRATLPDLILMDISIEGANGIELTKTLRKRFPTLRVLVLSMHDESLYAERALAAGARGYLMKQEPPEVLLRAIRQVLNGGVFVSDHVTEDMLGAAGPRRVSGAKRLGIHRLSDRELEVFEWFGRGQTTREISERLGLSAKTVEAHRAHICRKLSVRGPTQFLHRACQWVEAIGATPAGTASH